jgi:hypothetical protein
LDKRVEGLLPRECSIKCVKVKDKKNNFDL